MASTEHSVLSDSKTWMSILCTSILPKLTVDRGPNRPLPRTEVARCAPHRATRAHRGSAASDFLQTPRPAPPIRKQIVYGSGAKSMGSREGGGVHMDSAHLHLYKSPDDPTPRAQDRASFREVHESTIVLSESTHLRSPNTDSKL